MTTRVIQRIKKTQKNRGKPRRKRRQRKGGGGRSGDGSGSAPSTGSRIGSTLGGILGGFAQKGLGKIFGLGEYEEALAKETGQESVSSNATPEVNSLVEPISTTDAVPLMHADKEGHVRFARREFVQLVPIETGVTEITIKINPGISGNFPWLSAVARNFQQYAFIGLAYEYVPTSGFAISGTNAALGSVSMAFVYDPSTNGSWPAGTLAGILNFQGSTSCSPAAAGCCYMECDPAFSNQPIRFCYNETTVGAPSSMSLQNYVVADFLLQTEGSQSTIAVQAGQLWVTYEVMLFNPRVQDPTPSVFDQPALRAYRAVHTRLSLMMNCIGPYTPEQAIIWRGEIRRIFGLFGTVKFLAALERAQVQSYRQQPHHDDEMKMEGAVYDIIAAIARNVDPHPVQRPTVTLLSTEDRMPECDDPLFLGGENVKLKL